MTIVDGATYRFKGAIYRAAIEDSELSGDTVASFQRLPINQPDDEPSVFLDGEGNLTNTDGDYMGAASELQEIR